MSDSAALNQRIDELESQLAFQDEMLESLNAVAARQDAEIVELKRRLDVLAKRIRAMADSVPVNDRDEAPPHY